MSGNLETQYRGETSQLEQRVSIREKLTPEYFEQERAKIFRRSWLVVGHAADLPEPGGYVVRNLPTLKTSLLIVRGRDGRVRSFHNVCSSSPTVRGVASIATRPFSPASGRR